MWIVSYIADKYSYTAGHKNTHGLFVIFSQ